MHLRKFIELKDVSNLLFGKLLVMVEKAWRLQYRC